MCEVTERRLSWPAAQDPLADAVAVLPTDDPDYAVRIAKLMLQHGNAHDALKATEQLVIHTPDDLGVVHLRGRCLEALGNIPGVRPHWCFRPIHRRMHATCTQLTRSIHTACTQHPVF